MRFKPYPTALQQFIILCMQIYSDMTLSGPEHELEALLERLDAQESLAEWQRDEAAEEGITRMLPSDEVVRCFVNSASSVNPLARLWIDVAAYEWKVTNIVPEGDSLSPAAYNALLSSFRNAILPMIDGTQIHISEPTSEVGPEHWLSSDATRLLHVFSLMANKSTGASHPRDRARWNAFVTAVHRDECSLSGDELRSILIEHEHWPEDKASDLAILFDYERSLLEDFVKSA